MLVKQLAGIAGPGEDQRLLGDILHSNALELGQGVARIDHQHHAVPKDRMDFQAGRLGR